MLVDPAEGEYSGEAKRPELGEAQRTSGRTREEIEDGGSNCHCGGILAEQGR